LAVVFDHLKQLASRRQAAQIVPPFEQFARPLGFVGFESSDGQLLYQRNFMDATRARVHDVGRNR